MQNELKYNPKSGENKLHPFGMLMPERSFSSTAYKYGYNDKEKDDEIKGEENSLDFGARFYDSRLGLWLSVDPMAGKYVSVSTYVFCLSNPIKYYDQDGRWVPGADKDNNVILTKEKGDTKKSLAKFMGDDYSEAQINKLWKSLNKETKTINLTQYVGGVFQEMKTAMTEAKARNNPTNVDYDVKPKRLFGKNMESNYNCWGSCIALNDGKKLEAEAVGIKKGDEFDKILTNEYTSTKREGATVGKTIVRYTDYTNVSTHGAIFMGIDKNGNEYLFSKNGWEVQPEIHTTKYIADWIKEYGSIKGIKNKDTGYYNKKGVVW